jgi:hypothetical protein
MASRLVSVSKLPANSRSVAAHGPTRSLRGLWIAGGWHGSNPHSRPSASQSPRYLPSRDRFSILSRPDRQETFQVPRNTDEIQAAVLQAITTHFTILYLEDRISRRNHPGRSDARSVLPVSGPAKRGCPAARSLNAPGVEALER